LIVNPAVAQRLRDLRARGLQRIVFPFDGESDSGVFTEDRWSEPGNVPGVTADEFTALEEWLYTLLPDGWELDAGSYGTLEIDFDMQEAALHISWRTTSEDADFLDLSEALVDETADPNVDLGVQAKNNDGCTCGAAYGAPNGKRCDYCVHGVKGGASQ
jgi:hypothetical protein